MLGIRTNLLVPLLLTVVFGVSQRSPIAVLAEYSPCVPICGTDLAILAFALSSPHGMP